MSPRKACPDPFKYEQNRPLSDKLSYFVNILLHLQLSNVCSPEGEDKFRAAPYHRAAGSLRQEAITHRSSYGLYAAAITAEKRCHRCPLSAFKQVHRLRSGGPHHHRPGFRESPPSVSAYGMAETTANEHWENVMGRILSAVLHQSRAGSEERVWCVEF